MRAEPALTAPAAFGDKLMQASDGSVYIGESRTIYRVVPGGHFVAVDVADQIIYRLRQLLDDRSGDPTAVVR